jgi:hypothetical protein
LKVEYEPEHIPNNPLAEDRKIGMSEEEWAILSNASPFETWKFVPWFY